MRRLEDGIYETCPLHGPKVFHEHRQIEIVNGSVRLTKPQWVGDNVDPVISSNWFSQPSFFDANLLFDKELNRVIQ